MVRFWALFAASLALVAGPASAQQPTAEQQMQIKAAEALVKSLKPATGEVAIDAARARIKLGPDYVFLDAADAKKVLTQAWGNPPDAVAEVLGMVMPAGANPYAPDSWGAIVTYQQTGFVTDDDAKTTDYDALLRDMQSGEAERNAERKEQGYPGQHLVGWAQPPSYEAASHSMVWARNLQIEGAQGNTLNYDMRLLGRRGVLSLNLITGMEQLPQARTAAAALARNAAFDPGARYADFDESVDEKAGYGIAGLVAGGAAAVAAKKLGLLAIIFAFGKKFLVLIVAGVAMLGGAVRKLFRRGEQPADEAI